METEKWNWPDGHTQNVVPVGWPDRTSGPWFITAHFGSVDGRRECVGVDIRSGGDGPKGQRPLEALTTTVLRKIPIVIKDLRADDQANIAGVLVGAHGFTKNPEVKRVLAETELSGLDHFLEVALTYHQAWSEGRDPVGAVHGRWPNRSRSTAGRWVKRARNEFKLLEPTTARQANGRLTKKALRLLEQKDSE